VTFTRQRPVFVGEDDASGLIFFVTYFNYVNEGEQLLFEEIGLPTSKQISQRLTMPAVHAECDYIAPAHAGEVLTQTTRFTAGTRSTVTSEHEFRNAAGDLVARAKVVRALTDLDTMRSVEIPPHIRALLDGGPPA
jgi:YbgC/YbaW family acyl-CoA thioester hydrolase